MKEPADTQGRLGAAHARFGRAALAIYLAAAAVSVTLLLADAVSEREHERGELMRNLSLQNEVRAQYVSQNMALLTAELERLARRSEVDLTDQNMGPERSLLELSHHQSTFFNRGVAIAGPGGSVMWSEPESFLPTGTNFGTEPWFQSERSLGASKIVPIHPERTDDSLVYVVAPIERSGRFEGTLIGGIDLARQSTMRFDTAPAEVQTIIATTDGTVVYPSAAPTLCLTPEWKALFHDRPLEGFLNATLSGKARVLVAAPITGSELLLIGMADPRELLAPAQTRLVAHVWAGLLLTVLPLGLLIVLLQRSLSIFRRSETEAVREERLRTLGEASNLIAHEIKNSLNNLRVGIDVMVRRSPSQQEGDKTGRDRVVEELKREIQRLSDFTGELMSFSKGVTPRTIPLDLASFVPEVASLSREAAAEIGASIDVLSPSAPLRVRADPSLVHVVVGNLVSNAVDAVSSRKDGGGRVDIRIERLEGSTIARVRVTDNGPGVPAEIRANLFEPFVTGKPSGVGIGLAISRKIALAHGGDLVLDSVETGASFSLTLPLEVS